MPIEIEIREPGAESRRVQVLGTITIGREHGDVIVADPAVSRVHLQLEPVDDGVLATDLDSANGTWCGDTRLRPAGRVLAGAILRIGQTSITVHRDQIMADARRPSTADSFRVHDHGDFVLYARPGSVGADYVSSMLASLRRARRKLSGFGSEPWGSPIAVYLTEAFADPVRPGNVVTSGSVVDDAANEIWFAVSAEMPPEAPERPLARLYGSVLPAAAELRHLIDGYGLVLAEADDPDPILNGHEPPPFDLSDEDARPELSLSFARHLVRRGGRASLSRLLTTAQPGRAEAAAQEHFGASLSALEDEWRAKLAYGADRVNPRQFLRLSLRYLRPHMTKQIEIGVYMLLSLVFTIVLPFASKRLFDDAIPSQDYGEVVTILTFLGIAFAVSLLAGLRQAYLAAYVGGAIVRDIRATMFDRLQAQSIGWFGRRQQGDVLSRMFNDVSLLEGGISQTLREGVFQVLTLIVSTIVMLRLSWQLGTVVLVGAPIVGITYRLMTNGAQRRSLAVQERQSGLFAVAAENYAAQPVVKAFGLEEVERRRFGAALQRLFTADRRLSLYGGFFGLSVNLIVTGLRIAVLALGSWLVIEGRLSLGTLVAFLGIMGEVIGPVTNLTGLAQEVQTATGALVRVNEILEQEPELAERDGAAPLGRLRDRIEMRDVRFGYAVGQRTLDGITFSVARGSRVAFVGPSGAGKSSILQLLLRNYDPDDGSVLVDGVDLRDATFTSLRQQIGVVFQDTFLFDLSIRDNIAMGKPGATATEVEAAARAAEVHDFIAGLPRGYDTVVGERGGRLSGGQRQRIAIARALVRDPSVLLLDEATSALDARTERLINDTLERVGHDRTTIAVTHRLSSLATYDRIFVVVAGAIVEAGTHADLLAQGGVYAELWSEQAGETASTHHDEIALADALRRLPAFADLDASAMADVSSRTMRLELPAGQRVYEGDGRLYVVLAGRGEVRGADDAQPLVELKAADAFGVSALLGESAGRSVVALDAMMLAVLDRVTLHELALLHPTIGAMLSGQGMPGPHRGSRLSRSTLGRGVALPSLPEAPSLRTSARRSGIMRSVG